MQHPLGTSRVAIVSGGNRGLGRATAEALAERGYHVVLGAETGEPASRSPPRWKSAVSRLRHCAVRGLAAWSPSPAAWERSRTWRPDGPATASQRLRGTR
jgi:NAD(P)-dependent dehydrogenase (short-subunit alcohol dehydrogenase family)